MSGIKDLAISAAAEVGGDLTAAAIEGAALLIPVIGETVGPVAALVGRSYVKNKIRKSLTQTLNS